MSSVEFRPNREHAKQHAKPQGFSPGGNHPCYLGMASFPCWLLTAASDSQSLVSKPGRSLGAFISREQTQPEGTYGFLLITEEEAWILVLNVFQMPSMMRPRQFLLSSFEMLKV